MQNVLSKRSLLGHPLSRGVSSGAPARFGSEELCEPRGSLDGPVGKGPERVERAWRQAIYVHTYVSPTLTVSVARALMGFPSSKVEPARSNGQFRLRTADLVSGHPCKGESGQQEDGNLDRMPRKYELLPTFAKIRDSAGVESMGLVRGGQRNNCSSGMSAWQIRANDIAGIGRKQSAVSLTRI